MSDEDKTPIIIRRKRGGGEEEHHGGVWKLAFADFMTAMMAFFLVMWLINSTSKETKAVIVQYFNPVQLTESSPAKKGVRDPKDPALKPAGSKKDETKAAEADEPLKAKEMALLKDPAKALDEIAARDMPPPDSESAAASSPKDPFDRAMRKEKQISTPHGRGVDGGADTPSASSEKPKTSNAAMQGELEKIIQNEAKGLQANIKTEVRSTDAGVVISLIDDPSFSMFEVGSVEPKPQAVRIIGQIGKMLESRSGKVEVHGHTDSRSYSKRNYDNWRLSSDRAAVVNYMLVRGGLTPTRIDRIIGYADRRLKEPRDPFSPLNRRIEILLQGAKE